MAKKVGARSIPQSGSRRLTPASGRSPPRRRGRQMETLLLVFDAVDALGARGREFGTTDVQKMAGISFSQAYGWLHALRDHGFVEGRLDKSVRTLGDWRWKRKFKLVKG